MAYGFIGITVKPGHEEEVYNRLQKIKELSDITPVFGEWDIVAKVEAHDFNLLGMVVVDKVRTIDGIVNTKTLTGITFHE